MTWSQGKGSHIDMVYICACLLRCFSVEFGIAIGRFSSETKEIKFKNWVYIEQIIVKSTQFWWNWVLSYWKWYSDGWVIGWKIGIEEVKFLIFDRHTWSYTQMVISQKVGEVWTWFWYQIKAESELLPMTPKTHFTQNVTCSLFCEITSHI